MLRHYSRVDDWVKPSRHQSMRSVEHDAIWVKIQADQSNGKTDLKGNTAQLTVSSDKSD